MIAVSIVEDMKDVRESLKRTIDSSEEFVCLSVYENAEDAVKDLT